MHNVHQSYHEADALPPDRHEALAPNLVRRAFARVCRRGRININGLNMMVIRLLLLPNPEHRLDKGQPRVDLAEEREAQAPVHAREGGGSVHHDLIRRLLGLGVPLGLHADAARRTMRQGGQQGEKEIDYGHVLKDHADHLAGEYDGG